MQGNRTDRCLAGRYRRLALAAALAATLAACGGAPPDQAAAENNDPAEPVNRAIHDANITVDNAVVKPVAKAYRDNVPPSVRQGVENMTNNLNEPFVAGNDLLQGNVSRAWTSVRRFAVNTTVGVGGVMDPAKEMNMPGHTTDVGQTLATWGVGEGPFVELPALGPSNARDAVGTVAGFVLNPLGRTGHKPVTEASYARGGADFLDTRVSHLDDLDELERTSIDLYATLRSVYRQHRDAEIEKAKRGEVGNTSDTPPRN